MQRLRTYLVWRRFIVRARWAYVVSLAGVVLSLVTLPIGSFSVTGVGVGSLGLLVGLVGVVADRVGCARAQEDLSYRRIHHDREVAWELDSRLVAAGYRRDDAELGIIYSPAVNEALRKGEDADVLVESRRRPVERPAGVAAAVVLGTHVSSGAVLRNDRKVCQVDDLALAVGDSNVTRLRPVRVQSGRYFDGLITNDMARHEVYSRAAHGVVASGPDLFVENGRVVPLSRSRCSNGVGASTLAVTRDDVLIVSRQGARSAVAANLLAPSGSGSADWADLRGVGSLRAFVVRVAERELREECGISDDAALTTTVLGFTRNLRRGGKPEYLCFTRVDVESHAVMLRRAERGLMYDHEHLAIQDRSHFRAEVRAHFVPRAHEISPLLRSHLWLLDGSMAAGWDPWA